MSNIQDYVNKVANKNYAEKDTLKRCSGTVVEVSSDNETAVISTIYGSVTLPNKTNQELFENDIVEIYYWKSMNKGYIALLIKSNYFNYGVGKFVDSFRSSEVFNDYETNILTNSNTTEPCYNHISGHNNSIIGDEIKYSHIIGNGNTINGNCNNLFIVGVNNKSESDSNENLYLIGQNSINTDIDISTCVSKIGNAYGYIVGNNFCSFYKKQTSSSINVLCNGTNDVNVYGATSVVGLENSINYGNAGYSGSLYQYQVTTDHSFSSGKLNVIGSENTIRNGVDDYIGASSHNTIIGGDGDMILGYGNLADYNFRSMIKYVDDNGLTIKTFRIGSYAAGGIDVMWSPTSSVATSIGENISELYTRKNTIIGVNNTITDFPCMEYLVSGYQLFSTVDNIAVGTFNSIHASQTCGTFGRHNHIYSCETSYAFGHGNVIIGQPSKATSVYVCGEGNIIEPIYYTTSSHNRSSNFNAWKYLPDNLKVDEYGQGTWEDINGSSQFTGFVSALSLKPDQEGSKADITNPIDIYVIGSNARVYGDGSGGYYQYQIDSSTVCTTTNSIRMLFSIPEVSNTMYLDENGNLNVSGTVESSSADYAEYWEWEDGNIDNEDRRGLLVTLDGKYIKLANSGDKILGIVSANPTILGNDDNGKWIGYWEKDIFGSYVYEEVEISSSSVENPDEIKTTKLKRRKVSKDFDETKPYSPRSVRAEFSPIAHMGQVIAVDDGSCENNCYCTASQNGVLTKSEIETQIVMLERIDETHIRVMIGNYN